jgi:hypothetical protein
MQDVEPWETPLLEPRLSPPAWSHRAACARTGNTDAYLEQMFSEESSSDEVLGPVLAMKMLCLDCPVRPECLTWALEQEDAEYREGIFGGLTPRERGQIADDVTAGLALLDEQNALGLVVRRLPTQPYQPRQVGDAVSA